VKIVKEKGQGNLRKSKQPRGQISFSERFALSKELHFIHEWHEILTTGKKFIEWAEGHKTEISPKLL